MVKLRFGPEDVREVAGALSFTTGEAKLPYFIVPFASEEIKISAGPVLEVSSIWSNGVKLDHQDLTPIAPPGYGIMVHEPDADGVRFTAVKLAGVSPT